MLGIQGDKHSKGSLVLTQDTDLLVPNAYNLGNNMDVSYTCIHTFGWIQRALTISWLKCTRVGESARGG